MPDALDHIREVWENTYPNYLYGYSFLDDNLARLYENERRIGQIFQIFAGLAILIGCLGLIGLVSFVTEQRTKEIGIRKVLGAHTGQILQHLSWDFLKLVLLAFALAVPVSYLLMERWLANFAYRVEVGPSVFAIAGAVIVGVALLSMSWQSLRAAMMNPVESLRSE
jgi:putative ABC transport system permease protein